MSQFQTIKTNDPFLKKILKDFRLQTNEGIKVYGFYPLDPLNSINHSPTLTFEVIEKSKWIRAGFFKRWFTAMRPVSLSSSVTPCLVALLIGLYLDMPAEWFHFTTSLFGVICLHLGVNLLNDYDDHMRLSEVPQGYGTRGSGGSGVIQKTWIPAIHLRYCGFFFLISGVIFGLPAFFQNPREIGILGSIGLFGALGYAGWPWRIKYRALGDGAVAFLLGPGVMMGITLATFNQIPLATIVAGVFFGFLAEGALHAHNLQDIPLDTNRNIMTLAKGLGFSGAKNFLVWIYFTSFGILISLALVLKQPLLVITTSVISPYVLLLLISVGRAEGPLSSGIRGLKQKAETIHLCSGLLIIFTLIYLNYFK